MDEKIGINIKEASEILGISKQLMAELTKLKDFPCIIIFCSSSHIISSIKIGFIILRSKIYYQYYKSLSL